MSIATELNRIIDAKADIIDAIEGKGVTVPSGKKIDELAPYIDDISGGGGTDISDADAAVGDVLASKTFYSVEEPRKTGTMVDRGTVSTDISAKATEVTIAAGKHSGSGVVKIATAEQNKIIAENIKKDIAILGVTGTLEGGGGGTDPIIRYYTAGATWTKPAKLSHVLVVCIGGGGGGASGARRAAGVVSRGGGGGGSGIIMRRVITAAQLDATETITVGAGGGGGAAQTSDDSANVAGTAGGNTSFGSLVLSQGALAGDNAGAGGAAGAITSQTPPQEAYSIHSRLAYNGLTSNTTGGANASSSSNVFMLTTTVGGGGAPGGSISATNLGRSGGGGGRAYNAANTLSAVKAGGTAGGGDGADGVDNWCDQLLLSFGGMETTHGYGTSGAGGGSVNAAAGGKGGNGGNYGAGGGGGGASRNGYASGAGGNGGAGLCIVMEFYGA
jgi:hypothetical protein